MNWLQQHIRVCGRCDYVWWLWPWRITDPCKRCGFPGDYDAIWALGFWNALCSLLNWEGLR
jgi:hypothetical protein